MRDALLSRQIKPDAGSPGFFIDYGPFPAHLELAGSYCATVSTYGANRVVMIQGCVAVPQCDALAQGVPAGPRRMLMNLGCVEFLDLAPCSME